MAHAQLHNIVRNWFARQGVTDLPENQRWLELAQLQDWPAGEILVRQGDTDDTLYYLDSGLVRLFYTTPEGRERNKAFYCAGQFTGPVSAAISGSPAPFGIECLEATTAVSFRYRDFFAAARDSALLTRLYTQLLEEAFIRNEQREAVLLTCNAQQRYAWLVANESELLERVPQFHLASYLGLDPVSLSRLKRKASASAERAH